MERFTVLNGLVAPLDRANVDTDQIIPKQFLKSIKRTGFGTNLFDAWRYLDEGQPDRPHASRTLNPDFVLNQPRYKGVGILLARKNFGCGSSREHAPIAMGSAGCKIVLAESFARIFFRNCVATGELYPCESIERICEPSFASFANSEVKRTCTPAEANGEIRALIICRCGVFAAALISSSEIP